MRRQGVGQNLVASIADCTQVDHLTGWRSVRQPIQQATREYGVNNATTKDQEQRPSCYRSQFTLVDSYGVARFVVYALADSI